MCILIIKGKGIPFPPLSAIESAIRNNPDGVGMAWASGGKLHTYKTMRAKEAISQYLDIVTNHDYRHTALIFHARIATHGSLGVANCHCWESFCDTSLHMAFAHNGILRIPNRDDMTDSETFLRDYFEPSFRNGGWSWACNTIRKHIGTSKFAFLDRKGKVHHFGQFITDDGGVLYSNTSYRGMRYAQSADPRLWDNTQCASRSNMRNAQRTTRNPQRVFNNAQQVIDYVFRNTQLAHYDDYAEYLY